MKGGYRCPLGKLQPVSIDTEKVKQNGWRDHAILVISADDKRLDYFQREAVKQIGEKLYGTTKHE